MLMLLLSAVCVFAALCSLSAAMLSSQITQRRECLGLERRGE